MYRLSYSKYNTFKKSKSNFIKKYILGEETFQTKEMSFGKYVAQEIESSIVEGRKNNYHSITSHGMLNPEYALDFKIEDIDIVGYIDLLDVYSDKKIIYEYKTGKEPWDQKRVDSHDQLLFYATGVIGELDKIECKLIWIETEEVNKRIIETGNVFEFSRIITKEETESFKEKIKETVEEMKKYEEDYVNNNNNEEIAKQVIELQEVNYEIKKLEEKAEEIKTNLQEKITDTITIGDATLYYTTRKTYEYSDEVKKLEASLKALKKKEEEEGIAQFKQTKSFSCRFK